MTIPEYPGSPELRPAIFSPTSIPGHGERFRARTGEVESSPSSAVTFSTALEEFDAIVEKVLALPDIRKDALSEAQAHLLAHHGEVAGDLVAAGLIRETLLNTVSLG